jgi:structural maintenance of chromosomes protein 5
MQLQEAEIMYLEANSDLEALEKDNEGITNELRKKKKENEELKVEKKKFKDEARKVERAVATVRDEADEALIEFIQDFDQEQSQEQLEAEIDGEKARLGLIHGGDANVIIQYEKREKEIAKLKEKLETINQALQEISDKIKEVRGKWEPKLDKLIGQISSSFSFNMSQINCNGQVDIHKDDDDYDQWAIIIHVRFRENEALTRLDSHRQSGGERAVSTIFYLMSLQSLTQSPFRVVDEINQGMDPRNERLVHSRMVAIATGNDEWTPDSNARNHGVNSNDNDDDDDVGDIVRQVDASIERAELGSGSGSQYFLVTPKLLHDLRYEEGMRVMCIMSGEHLPGKDRDIQEISFAASLEIRRRMNLQATSPGTGTGTAATAAVVDVGA